MRNYYIIMERPVGSHIWTFAALAMSRGDAQGKALRIMKEKGNCAWVVATKLPKKPDERLHATFFPDETPMINGGPNGAN